MFFYLRVIIPGTNTKKYINIDIKLKKKKKIQQNFKLYYLSDGSLTHRFKLDKEVQQLIQRSIIHRSCSNISLINMSEVIEYLLTQISFLIYYYLFSRITIFTLKWIK